MNTGKKPAVESGLAPYIDQKVEVITNEGQVLVGILKGFDQTTNIILQDCEERAFSLEQETEMVPLGLYLIRGDTIAVVGLLDEEVDESVNWTAIKAAPIQPLKGHVVY